MIILFCAMVDSVVVECPGAWKATLGSDNPDAVFRTVPRTRIEFAPIDFIHSSSSERSWFTYDFAQDFSSTAFSSSQNSEEKLKLKPT